MQSVPNNSEQIFLIISIKIEYLITNIKTITPKRGKAFRGQTADKVHSERNGLCFFNCFLYKREEKWYNRSRKE